MAEAMLKAGGVFNIGLAVFHMLFWGLFNWKEELAKLSGINQAIVQIMNLCLVFVFVIFGYVSLAHTRELLITPLGRALLILIAVFWLARALEQIWLSDYREWGSWIHFILCLVGSGLYAFPALLFA